MRVAFAFVLASSLLGSSLLFSETAFAETDDPAIPSLDLRGYRVPMDHHAGMYLEPATTPGTGEITAGLRLNYAFRPVVIHDSDDTVKYSVVQHQLTADLFATVGLFHRLAVGVDLPAVIAQSGDDVSADPTATALVGNQSLPVTALGDPGIVVKATFVKPSQPDDGVAFGLLDRLTLPLGDRRSFLGEGAVTDEARLLFDGHFLRYFTAHLTAGAKLRANEGSYGCGAASGDDCLSRFGHELLWGAGLELDSKLIHIEDLSWFVEARGYLPLAPVHPFESRLPSGTFANVAARYGIGDVGIMAGTEVALDSGVGNAPFRITVGISFAPHEHDRDHDGIDDEHDRCPDRAEDFDGVEDDDGCPESNGERAACEKPAP